MNTHLLALQLMAAQGLLGAFDTLYHHELTEALPRRASARRELAIHAVRALIYSLLFVGLSAWTWQGGWALVLLAQPTALAWQTHGWLSVFLAVCGIGVGISGVRDGLAAAALLRAEREPSGEAIAFSVRKQSVLLTGATGFIGQRLVAALLRDGHEVSILTRAPKPAAWLFDGAVRCIGSMDELQAGRRIDVVINLAGARILGWRWSEKRKAALRRSRVALTDGVVAWIARAEHKPRLLLSASAIGYYGVQAMGDLTPLDETAPPQPVFMSQLCQEWEAAARAAERYGVQVACMRFGLVFGAQGALPMMLLPVRLGVGGPMGGGRQRMSWIHVDDVLRGIAHLWRLSEGGGGMHAAYNFTAPQQVSQAEFSRIAAGLARRPSFLPTPGWPVRLLLGEQADLLLEGQTVVPARLLESGYVFRHPTVSSALAGLL